MNAIDLEDGTFAIKKYCLPPRYYKQFPEVKAPDSQIRVDGVNYVVMQAEHIVDDIDELLDPHPMDSYNYPMMEGMQPYAHQIYTSRFIATQLLNPAKRGVHVHNSMGTGKSLSTMWVLDFLFKTNQIKKALIVAPKVVMRSAWAKEILNHFPHLNFCIKEKKYRDVVSDAQIDIINHDGLTKVLEKHSQTFGHGEKKRVIYNFTACEELYDVIVYDEATAIKTSTTTRWKALNKYFEFLHTRFKSKLILLTGTPVAQSPVDAYAQAKLITPEAVPSSLTKWKELTMMPDPYVPYKWNPMPTAGELCSHVLQPSVRFELSDSTDLPEHTFIDVATEKTPRQKKLFNQMAQEFIMALDDDKEVTAANGAAKASKLLQLLAGAVYDAEKNVYEIEATEKLEALTEIIDQLPEEQPAVVFVDFKAIQQLLKEKLLPKYKTVEIINGETSGEERSAIVQRVLDCKTKVVIAHPATASLGVDFVSTNVIIWYSPTYRNELYLQALDRIRRLSSVERGFTNFFVYHLVSDPIESDIYKGLHEKTGNQNDIFERMRFHLAERGIK